MMLPESNAPGNENGSAPFRCEFITRLAKTAKVVSLIPEGADGDAPLGRGLPITRGLIAMLHAHGLPAKTLPRALADAELLGLAVLLCNEQGQPTLYSCSGQEGGGA